jgi:hypothetical protein
MSLVDVRRESSVIRLAQHPLLHQPRRNIGPDTVERLFFRHRETPVARLPVAEAVEQLCGIRAKDLLSFSSTGELAQEGYWYPGFVPRDGVEQPNALQRDTVTSPRRQGLRLA